MKRLLLLAFVAIAASGQSIQVTNDGLRSPTATKGKTTAHFVSADAKAACYVVMDADSPLAAEGASATVTITRADSGGWTSQEKSVSGSDVRTKIERPHAGTCFLTSADSGAYPLGAIYSVSVR